MRTALKPYYRCILRLIKYDQAKSYWGNLLQRQYNLSRVLLYHLEELYGFDQHG